MNSKRYVVDPPICGSRVDNKVYARVKVQTDKWEPQMDMDADGNGNIKPVMDRDTGKFLFKEYDFGKGNYAEFQEDYASISEAISSAMLLYRLLCHYKCTVISEGPDGYKTVWWVTLKHKATGEMLTFGEWKGAAGVWTKFVHQKEAPKVFIKDMLLLLEELCAQDCPHPYDRCVAGSIA